MKYMRRPIRSIGQQTGLGRSGVDFQRRERESHSTSRMQGRERTFPTKYWRQFGNALSVISLWVRYSFCEIFSL
ncbi:hypothetical protein CDAR_440701 [Caerostris darwini]|uniref:Uncharacterized protein n=1 Tax=Caerostris darwini TaxID=1538125 RepID=A0AAV4ML20_9ARAC|nr:hypothetical protein CDAR_440701 [Caerostris darwini]